MVSSPNVYSVDGDAEKNWMSLTKQIITICTVSKYFARPSIASTDGLNNT